MKSKMKVLSSVITSVCVLGTVTYAGAFAAGKAPLGNLQSPFVKKAYVEKERPELTDEQKAETRLKLEERLAAEVADGKITQEEADQRLSDFDAGKMFFKGGRGFHDEQPHEKPELTDEQKAEMRQNMADKLAEAVADGKMTQEEADQRLSDFDDGKMFFKGGRGFHDEQPREKPELTDEQKAEMRQNIADKLAKAVADGIITQEDADQRLKDFDDGKMFSNRELRFGGQKIDQSPEVTDEQKAEMRQRLADSLSEAVKDGKITQEEADQRLENYDNGKMMFNKRR